MPKTSGRLRFAEFELDPALGTLRRNGAIIRLPRQPFKALTLLAGHPGEVVTREHLRRELWGDETVVDFEHGLNTCIRQIRTALGEDADGARIIETIPRLGYRFRSQIRAAPSHRPLSRIAVCLLLVIAMGAAASYLVLTTMRPASGVVRLAVLPFSSPDETPDSRILGEGVAEDVIARLASYERVQTISRTSAFAFRGNGLSLREIGQRLRVAAILAGSVRRSAGMLEIKARLVEVPAGRELWSHTWVRPLAEVFAVQGEIAGGVAGVLRLHRLRSPKQWPTQSPEAYLRYLRGRSAWERITPGGARAALELFRQAAELDPAYAQAYAGMADAYWQLSFTQTQPPGETCSQAQRAVDRALALDPALPDAHLASAWFKSSCERNWEGAEGSYRLALELDPNRAETRSRYGTFLSLRGRFEAALDQVRQAESLDPLSPKVRWEVASVLYYARRFDEAIEQCRRTLELDPNYGWAWHTLGQSYLEKAQYTEAIHALLRKESHPKGNLGNAYARAGRVAEARELLDRLETQYREQGLMAGQIAMVYAGLGDRNRAMEWLERAYAAGNWLGTLKVAPVFDPLRGEPRFNRLLENVGLAR